jgi:hypothetical protein
MPAMNQQGPFALPFANLRNGDAEPEAKLSCELAIAEKEMVCCYERNERGLRRKATAQAVGDGSWDGVDKDVRLWCWAAFRPPVTVPGPAQRAN